VVLEYCTVVSINAPTVVFHTNDLDLSLVSVNPVGVVSVGDEYTHSKGEFSPMVNSYVDDDITLCHNGPLSDTYPARDSTTSAFVTTDIP
jgi:hypothetical protein